MKNNFESKAFKTTIYLNGDDSVAGDIVEAFKKEGIKISGGGGSSEPTKIVKGITDNSVPSARSYLVVEAPEGVVKKIILDYNLKDRINTIMDYGLN